MDAVEKFAGSDGSAPIISRMSLRDKYLAIFLNNHVKTRIKSEENNYFVTG